MGSEIVLSDVITDIAAGPFGSNLKVSCFVPSGFPIIDGANLKGFKVTDNLTKFVTEEKARSLSRSIAKRGDVVVTISGTLGQISYIPEDSAYEEYLCSQRQFKVTFDTSKVYVPYLVFYFHTREGRGKLLAFANQTGVPALAQPTKNFKRITLELPELEQQRKIALIAELLTAKIEANAKLNDYLLELTRVLFAHWFKDFAPFQDEETYVTEIGDIPASVKLVPLAELTKVITKGTTPTTLGFEYKESGINFIKGESIGDDHSFDYGKFAHIDEEANAALKRSVIEDRDLLFTIAGTLGRFAMAEKGMIPANTNQAVGIIRADERLLTPEVLLSYFIGGWQEDYYARRIQQAVQANLSLTTLKSLPVPVLEGKKRFEYEEQIIPVIHAIEANNAENRRLSELRDALLPKLMSGEIDVSKIDLTQLNNHLAKSLRQLERYVSPHKNGAARTPASRPVPLAIAS